MIAPRPPSAAPPNIAWPTVSPTPATHPGSPAAQSAIGACAYCDPGLTGSGDGSETTGRPSPTETTFLVLPGCWFASAWAINVLPISGSIVANIALRSPRIGRSAWYCKPGFGAAACELDDAGLWLGRVSYDVGCGSSTGGADGGRTSIAPGYNRPSVRRSA